MHCLSKADIAQDDSARWRNDFRDIGALVHFCLSLAKQFLAGDKGLFIVIFPEIAEDEAAFLIPDMRDHLA